VRRAPVTRLVARAVSAGALLALHAQAQTPTREAQRLPELTQPITTADDTRALRLNPANLAFLPGTELRWTGTFPDSAVATPWQGHAFALGTRIPFLGVTTGLRFDWVSPPRGFNLPSGDNDYQWLTWGVAARTSPSGSLGLSLQRSFARGPLGRELAGVSLGWTQRFGRQVGISLVGENVNRPRNQYGNLTAAYGMGLALRPLGQRSLEVGLEAQYLTTAKVWAPRALLGIGLGSFGRLAAEGQVQDPFEDGRAWLAALSLTLHLNQAQGSSEFSGALAGGDLLGSTGAESLQVGVAARSFTEPGAASLERFAARVRLENTPGPREHVALLRHLWHLTEEPGIKAVALELRAAPAGSMAAAQELRDALLELRRVGKPVLCHVDDAGASELYVCATANRLVMHPGGGLHFAGLHTSQLYFGGLLRKIGVTAQVVRIGAHKSAPETFSQEGASEVARADQVDRLQQFERQLTEAVAAGRGKSFDQVRSELGAGPYGPEGALRAQLIDAIGFEDEIDEQVNQLVGYPVSLVAAPLSPAAPERFAGGRGVAIVYLEGEMVSGRSDTGRLFSSGRAGSFTVGQALEAARGNPSIAAVVLRIDSPGGSSLAAEELWREVQLTARRKPVVVSMAGAAASGGYYVAAAGTRIFANPLSITGSIGVFFLKADLSGLLARLGINVEVYKSAPQADAEDAYRPWTPAEERVLEARLRDTYTLFLKRVASGRAMSTEAIDTVGQGRVWTGEQAQTRGLVDELGGLRQALAHARSLAGLPDFAPIVELPRVPPNFLAELGVPDRLIEAALPGDLLEDGQALSSRLAPLVQDFGPWLQYSESTPLTRLLEPPIEW
jgi:protease IV